MVHSVKCFCLPALCLSGIFPSKSPKASLIRDISEHKWVPSCHIYLISVLYLKLTEESQPQFNISVLRSFVRLVSVQQLTSFISHLRPLLSFWHMFFFSLIPPYISLSPSSHAYLIKKSDPTGPDTTLVPTYHLDGVLMVKCMCVCVCPRYNSVTQG